MKAIISTAYGTPDVLQLREVAKPTPKDNEVLIRVHAATVGPSDCAFRKGDPFIVKLMYGLQKPKFEIGGTDFAGEVEAVGKEVTRFRKGDRVFGLSPDDFGTHAEYKCMPENGLIVTMPEGYSYAEVVAISDGTALTFLRDVAKIQRGQRVLINGASGAVGSYAVQLAKHFGTHVTGVCSGANVEMVKRLGADQVIDYTREDFTKCGETYDVIFDAVGKRSFGECKRALTAQGVYMNTVPTLTIVIDILRTLVGSGKKAKFTTAGLKQNVGNLDYLKGLLATGAIRPVIDRCYGMEEIAAAHAYVETERKRGIVMIIVGEESNVARH